MDEDSCVALVAIATRMEAELVQNATGTSSFVATVEEVLVQRRMIPRRQRPRRVPGCLQGEILRSVHVARHVLHEGKTVPGLPVYISLTSNRAHEAAVIGHLSGEMCRRTWERRRGCR